MKIKEFLNATPAELITRRTNMKHEVMNLRLQQKSGQIARAAEVATGGSTSSPLTGVDGRPISSSSTVPGMDGRSGPT